MNAALALASAAMLAAGAAFCLVGALGVLRMPDFYTRIHAASLSDNTGALLVVAGLMIHAGAGLVTAKLALVALLVLFTSPVATHALAKAALARGVRPHLAQEPPSKP